MRSLIFLFLSSVIICSLSCTNGPDLNQVDKRVSESLSGDYPIQGDIPLAGDQKFSFAVFGDSHVGGRYGAVLETAIADAKAAGVSFVVSVGDLTDGGTGEQFQTFVDAFANAGLTVRVALGNHDIFFGGWGSFRSVFGAATYSFNADNVHFSVLDSSQGVLGQKQLSWLEKDLAQTTKPLKIIITHTPPYAGRLTSIWRMSSDDEIAILKDICYRYNVNLLFSGHYHGYREITIGNTEFITTGAVNTLTEIGEHKHYVRVNIDGNSYSRVLVDL